MSHEYDACRNRLRRCLRKVIRDSQEILTVVESWNDNRAEEAPFDCEVEKVMLPVFRRMLHAVETNTPIAARDNATWKRYINGELR